jgi:hypothetical protein
MFCEVKTRPRFTNCPRCGSTNAFLSAFNNKSYCVSCRKLYDRSDETRIRKQLITSLKDKDFNMQEFELIFSEYQDLSYKNIDDTYEIFNPSISDVAHGRLIHLT